MVSQNPFFVGGRVPLESFIGRTSEVKIAFDQISKCGHAAFYGSTGIGKSSLLQYLASPQAWEMRGLKPSKAFIVYLNCSGIYPFKPSFFWREVLSLLKEQAEDNGSLQTAIEQLLQEETVEKGDLRRVLRQIGQQNQFLLLLLDDYDVALYPNDQYTEAEMLTFLSEFRDLAVHSQEGRYLSTIVMSFRRLNELGPKLPPGGSPWYNHYLFLPLRPFSNNEINSLFDLPITPTLRKGVLEITGGHPALLQIAGYLLYDTLAAQQTPDLEAFTRDFQSRSEQFFHNAWKWSTEVEQLLLMLIALCRLEGRLNRKEQYALVDIDLILSQRSRELIDLEERGMVKHTVQQEKKVYSFASSMMEWWVIREIENSDNVELQNREKVFLKLMSREQAQRVKKVIQQVWQSREAAKSLIEWIVGTLKATS